MPPANKRDTRREYRVRQRDWHDLRCATVTASSPQHAAECYVECSDSCNAHVSDGDEFEIVVIEVDNGKRHNILVRATMRWSYEARKPGFLQKENW